MVEQGFSQNRATVSGVFPQTGADSAVGFRQEAIRLAPELSPSQIETAKSKFALSHGFQDGWSEMCKSKPELQVNFWSDHGYHSEVQTVAEELSMDRPETLRLMIRAIEFRLYYLVNYNTPDVVMKREKLDAEAQSLKAELKALTTPENGRKTKSFQGFKI